MNIVKYIALFVWSLLLLSLAIYIIRSHSFISKKKDEGLNTSEAIYTFSLLIAAALVMEKVIKAIALAFDTFYKLSPGDLTLSFLKTASVISVAGILLFLIFLFAAQLLSMLILGRRKLLVEFNSNGIPYALVRSAILLSIVWMYFQFSENIFAFLSPSISIPFYR